MECVLAQKKNVFQKCQQHAQTWSGHDHMNKWDDCAQIAGKTGCRYRGGQWSRRRFCARTVFRFVCLKSTLGVSDEDKLFTTF